MTNTKPTSGGWISLDTAFVGDAIVPVRRGHRYPWDHPSVQAAPGLFVPDDMRSEDVDLAMAAYRNSWLDETAGAASEADMTTSSGIPVKVVRRST